MKRTTLILRSSLLLLVLLGGFSVVGSASGAGNRCTDRCADRYKVRKDVCKAIPYKHARLLPYPPISAPGPFRRGELGLQNRL